MTEDIHISRVVGRCPADQIPLIESGDDGREVHVWTGE